MSLGGGLSQLEAAAIPAHVDRHIPPVGPTRLPEGNAEGLDPAQALGIVFGNGYHQADALWRAGRRLRQGATVAAAADEHGRAYGSNKLAPVHGALHNETVSRDGYDLNTSQQFTRSNHAAPSPGRATL